MELGQVGVILVTVAVSRLFPGSNWAPEDQTALCGGFGHRGQSSTTGAPLPGVSREHSLAQAEWHRPCFQARRKLDGADRARYGSPRLYSPLEIV